MEEIEALYRKHAPAVLRFALGLTGNVSRAEDLVSETFLKILVRAPEIRTQTALAYLFAVARNAYLSDIRRHGGRYEELTEEMPSAEQGPAQRHASATELAAVNRAVAALPEGERAALLMKAEGDLDYDDIAAALGISVVAAKVRVHRARQRLAAALSSNPSVHRSNP